MLLNKLDRFGGVILTPEDVAEGVELKSTIEVLPLNQF